MRKVLCWPLSGMHVRASLYVWGVCMRSTATHRLESARILATSWHLNSQSLELQNAGSWDVPAVHSELPSFIPACMVCGILKLSTSGTQCDVS